METLLTGFKWIDAVLPKGLPIKFSTIITGPGGSGKPLIGETFVSAWLKAGVSLVFMSLQYPSTDFISESIKNVPYNETEIQIPISPDTLNHIKKVADHSRSKVIPAISKI